MEISERMKLIEAVGEEVLTTEELKTLLESKKHPVAYDGFEPSGKIHIAQGIVRAINVNKMTKAGCKFKMLVADWHAWANNKMGGDLDKIRRVGEYFVEVWKAAGMDLDNVEFIWVTDAVEDEEYWKRVMQIARNTTLQRMLRTTQIMGRSENDTLQASQILYPCMQAGDIFHLDVDICQLGMDQRKVNILARELAPKLGWKKPVAVHHHMLMGLGQPPVGDANAIERSIDLKMSKSKPDSAIFMNDSEEEIKRKISKAYCPDKVVAENPIMEYCRYIVFEKTDVLEITRPEKYGGSLTISSIEELEHIFQKGELHPMDLKQAVAREINNVIAPVRKHFETNAKARSLLEDVKSYEVTR
jgi:tyrosyl-tRNA synthetase